MKGGTKKMEETFEMEIEELTEKQSLDIEEEITKRANGREVERWNATVTAKVKFALKEV